MQSCKNQLAQNGLRRGGDRVGAGRLHQRAAYNWQTCLLANSCSLYDKIQLEGNIVKQGIIHTHKPSTKISAVSHKITAWATMII